MEAHEQLSPRERMKKEMALQVRLACRLYGTEDPQQALMKWTEHPEDPESPAAKFREYVPHTNLEAVTPEELDHILFSAGIKQTLH